MSYSFKSISDEYSLVSARDGLSGGAGIRLTLPDPTLLTRGDVKAGDKRVSGD